MECTVQVSNADVFIPTTGLVDERTVRSAPKLKLIVQPAAGHNNIAVETAASLGIPVCTAPGTEHLLVATHQCHAGFGQPHVGFTKRGKVCKQSTLM